MMSDDNARNIDILIAKHKKRLQALKEQQAVYGISADPHIPIEISEIEGEINKLQTHRQEIEIKSPSITTTQIDFSKLETLLSTSDWVEGDDESKRLLQLIFESTKAKHDGYVSYESAPCEYLSTLDKLWLKYSKGHFGLSVQNRIWQTIPKERESDEWKRVANFGIHLEWLGKNEINRNWGFFELLKQEKLRWVGTSEIWNRVWNITNIRELPQGYLPYLPTFSVNTKTVGGSPDVAPWSRWCFYYFKCIRNCQL